MTDREVSAIIGGMLTPLIAMAGLVNVRRAIAHVATHEPTWEFFAKSLPAIEAATHGSPLREQLEEIVANLPLPNETRKEEVASYLDPATAPANWKHMMPIFTVPASSPLCLALIAAYKDLLIAHNFPAQDIALMDQLTEHMASWRESHPNNCPPLKTASVN